MPGQSDAQSRIAVCVLDPGLQFCQSCGLETIDPRRNRVQDRRSQRGAFRDSLNRLPDLLRIGGNGNRRDGDSSRNSGRCTAFIVRRPHEEDKRRASVRFCNDEAKVIRMGILHRRREPGPDVSRRQRENRPCLPDALLNQGRAGSGHLVIGEAVAEVEFPVQCAVEGHTAGTAGGHPRQTVGRGRKNHLRKRHFQRRHRLGSGRHGLAERQRGDCRSRCFSGNSQSVYVSGSGHTACNVEIDVDVDPDHSSRGRQLDVRRGGRVHL